MGQMEELVSCTPRTALRFQGFMVAWDGVLTLAYAGFPSPLVDLKKRIMEQFPDLSTENPGSKWPKTTLGALADDSPPLDLSQLRTLKTICEKHNEELKGAAPLHIGKLAVVVFYCCSLEKRVLTHSIDLQQGEAIVDITQEQSSKVNDILAEFGDDQLDHYIKRVNTTRNRVSHYRNPRVGCTLVFELPQPLPDVLNSFRASVDQALGKGFYEWFDPSSLHVTVRGL